MSEQQETAWVLCAQVCDSALLRRKLGEAETRHAMERCLHRMQRAAAGFNGRLLKAGATELVAFFAAADEAIHAACEMQQRVDDLPPLSGIKLAVKLACHGASLAPSTVPGEAATHAWRLAAAAKPGQILMGGDTSGLLQAGHPLHPLAEGQSASLSGESAVMELRWQEAGAAPHARSPAAPVLRLKLAHGNRQFSFGPEKRAVAMGRDSGNDVVIKDRRASRRHARIERRDDAFIIRDSSSNGTYISFAGGEEVALKGQELLLSGSGRISFGRARGPETAEVVEFEILPVLPLAAGAIE